ncbi:MAG TPA: hypothetical protein VIF60_24825 [Burkholderiaceae bacterium]
MSSNQGGSVLAWCGFGGLPAAFTGDARGAQSSQVACQRHHGGRKQYLYLEAPIRCGQSEAATEGPAALAVSAGLAIAHEIAP